LCVSGPRDIVEIANRSKQRARINKITVGDVDSVTRGYSEEKVNGLFADYGDVYEDINFFVEKVLQGCSAELKGADLAILIEERGMVNDSTMKKKLEAHEWYRVASKERLVLILYQTGVFGIRGADGRVVYSYESGQQSTQDVVRSLLSMHPAFRPHLGAVEAS